VSILYPLGEIDASNIIMFSTTETFGCVFLIYTAIFWLAYPQTQHVSMFR